MPDLSRTVYGGRVKWFNRGKGYGFVVPKAVVRGSNDFDLIGKDVFVHVRDVMSYVKDAQLLYPHDVVMFAVSRDALKGNKPTARNVKVLKHANKPKINNGSRVIQAVENSDLASAQTAE